MPTKDRDRTGSETGICGCGAEFTRRTNDRGQCPACREMNPDTARAKSGFRMKTEAGAERNARELDEGVQRVKERARQRGERVVDTTVTTRFDPGIIPPPPPELDELRARVKALPTLPPRERGRELAAILRIYFEAVRDSASGMRIAYDLLGRADRPFATKVSNRLRDADGFSQTGENVFDWPSEAGLGVGERRVGKPAKEWQLTPDVGEFEERGDDGPDAAGRADDAEDWGSGDPGPAGAAGVLPGGGDAAATAAAGRGAAAAGSDGAGAGEAAADGADGADGAAAVSPEPGAPGGEGADGGDRANGAGPGRDLAADDLDAEGEAGAAEAAPAVLSADEAAAAVRVADGRPGVDLREDAEQRSSSLSQGESERTDDGDPESGSASLVPPPSGYEYGPQEPAPDAERIEASRARASFEVGPVEPLPEGDEPPIPDPPSEPEPEPPTWETFVCVDCEEDIQPGEEYEAIDDDHRAHKVCPITVSPPEPEVVDREPVGELVQAVPVPSRLPDLPSVATAEDVHFAYLRLLFELARDHPMAEHVFDRIERRMVEGPPEQ